MINPRSIHLRLTVWYAFALVICQLLLAIALWASMRHLLLNDARELLTGQLASSISFVQMQLEEPGVNMKKELMEFSAALNRGTYLRVTNNGVVIFDSNPSFPWLSRSSRVRWHHQPYMMLDTQQNIHDEPWTFTAAISTAEAEVLLRRLRILLLVLVPFAAAIASVGGRWLSRRALKPVDEMTAAARSISAVNLSERLTIPRTGDELERLGDTWNSMLSKLEEALKRLTRFTADASHELRTPLSVIRTTAELSARRSRSAEAYRDALQQVAAESERMTKLLDDLLLLARVDAEAVDMPKSVLNLVPVLNDLCSQFGFLADAKQLQISFSPPQDAMVVLGNEAAIRRLISALLDNAVKYSRNGAEVCVLLRNSIDQITLEVIDNGPGIAESEMALIFERFYRGTHSQMNAKEGSGLGLSLAAGLAERNNARIEVVSEPGAGSTFRVLFPIAA